VKKKAHTSYRNPLVPAALVLTLMWSGVLALSVALESRELVALGAGGLLLTTFAIGFLHRHQEHLRKLAETDSLTGLTNHGGFHAALNDAVRAARQRSEEISLVALDLDDFKAINDNHGHPYGDKILKRVASALRDGTRDSDIVARIGGEEFALILPKTKPPEAYEIAERVRGRIEEKVETRDAAVWSSAGIATYPTDAADAATLYELADGALYWAKRAGKRRTRHYDPEEVPRDYTEKQRAEVRRVLANPELLESHFQPVVALATGQVVGYEALARFKSEPPRPPMAWFMQANGCGLGPALEAAAIKAALEPLGRPPGAHLALNVSPSALTSRHVQEVLPNDLTDLVIEITEHEAIRDDASLSRALDDVRDRGALIAIDDAGAGYSGLKQLAKVKPDIVKLDRNLIQEIHTDPARLALIESFVRYSNRIGATVCAEGIETLDELAALADLDVQWGQGFVLARPAAEWPKVAPEAANVCRAGLDAALRETSGARQPVSTAGDRSLEHLSARLAGARSREDLEDALSLIARELHAGEVSLSQWHPDEGTIETLAGSRAQSGETRHSLFDYPLTRKVLEKQEAVQVLISDPASDPREVKLLLELGHSSLLMVPVVHRGESLGLLEAFSGAERPWTRAEINRARIIASQFASVIEAFFLEPAQRSEGNGRRENGQHQTGRAVARPRI
jgi:diguanylate cyclase (GGDEF)-like protein